MAFARRRVSPILDAVQAWKGQLIYFIYGFASRVRPTGPDGVVTVDVACRRGGYNLRTLRVKAKAGGEV